MRSRKTIKKIVKLLFRIAIIPIYLMFRLLITFCNQDSVFHSFSQCLSLIPGKLGIFIRAAFYHFACPDTSEEISVGFLTVLSHRDTSIGTGVYIGSQCNIGKCSIGSNTLLGSGVHILSGKKQHNFEDLTLPIQEQGGNFVKVAIGEDCWLGNNSVIMANIAEHSIVAAGSVVTKELSASGSIVAGNPAKLIKQRKFL